MATTTTYPPNITTTVKLLSLKDDATLITTIDGDAGDTLTLTVFARNGTQIGGVLSVAGGEIVGDGAANYTAYITTPSASGSYYLQWDMTINSHVGQKTYDFQVRPRTG